MQAPDRFLDLMNGFPAPLPPPAAGPALGVSRSWSRRLAALLLAWAIATAAAAALDPDRPVWRNVQDVWDVESGLPQSSVIALAQTPDGYLWAGTYDGLARFDGFRFAVFRPADSPGLRNGAIRSLLVGRDGRLWIGTGGGGLSVRERDGVIRAIAGTEGWLVRTLAEAADGTIWIGTSGHGLQHLVGDATRAVVVAAEVTSVNALHADADGTLWIGSDGTGLWRRPADQSTATRVDTGSANLIVALHCDRRQALWIGTAGGGALILPATAERPQPADTLGTRTVSAFAEDRAGSLWMASSGGLLRRSGNRTERHSRDTGLPHDMIAAVLEDREGALWLGMAGAGLVRLQGGSFSSVGRSDGLAEDAVYSIVEDGAGELWVASVSGGLARGSGQVFEPEEIPGLPERTPLRSLSLAPDGTLWVATYGQGVLERRPAADRSPAGSPPPGSRRTQPGGPPAATWRFHTEADGLPNNHVRAILADSTGTVWAATVRGLGRLRDGRWTTAGTTAGLPSASLIALAEGSDGALWFGMDGGGLGRREPNGALSFYGLGDGLASNVVLSLRPGADRRTLWIGTNGGLSRFADGRFTTWTTRHGLPADNVAQVAEDGAGFLWLGTSAGVARVPLIALVDAPDSADPAEPAPLPLRVFGRGSGMVSSQATAPSNGPLIAGDGRLWFPTLVGLAVVDPRRLIQDEIAPIVHVEQVLADGKLIPLGVDGKMALPRGTARLEIRYTGICTRAAQLVRFRHRLEGFDATWVDAQNQRAAYYTAVPPGDYRFEVMATNADGEHASATLELRVPRRFWETGWFRWGGLLLLASGIASSIWGRAQAMQRRQRALEVTVAERTEALREANLELEDRNRQLAELSLRDPLTGLANRRRFEEAYDAEWRRAARSESWLSLALVDVDCFKQYNDSLGHAAGDTCLRQIGTVLAKASNRAGEVVARWGGEEFAVLVPAATPDDCRRLAEILRHQVAALDEPHPTSTVSDHITVSIGVASIRPSRGGRAEELFAAADAALYDAKRRGRNRIETVVLASSTPSGGVTLPGR